MLTARCNVIHHPGKPKYPLLGVLVCLLLAGCSGHMPRNTENLCAIFEEKRSWYKAAKRSEERWNVPLQIPMAVLYQESRFRARAKPPRDYVLGFIPWGRVSSAYGYAQAKTGTWKDYRRETGNRWADRDEFADAIDFVGWYIDKTQRINKVSKWDARALYLNYHDGWGGYRHGTHQGKRWLLETADSVHARASRYGAQYRDCKERLEAGWLKRLFR